jgi:hypothetical protein
VVNSWFRSGRPANRKARPRVSSNLIQVVCPDSAGFFSRRGPYPVDRETGFLEPVGCPRGQRTFPHAAQAVQHGERHRPVTQGGQQLLLNPPAADEPFLQTLDAVFQDRPDRLRPGVRAGRGRTVHQFDRWADGAQLGQGEGRVYQLVVPLPLPAGTPDFFPRSRRRRRHSVAPSQESIERRGEFGRPVVHDAGGPAEDEGDPGLH